MPQPIVRAAASGLAVAAALALSSCYEVENGPAFSGGDEVPGLEATLYTVGRISPDDGSGFQPVTDPADIEIWSVRRALNGSYFMSQQDGDEDSLMVVRPRLISGGDYVIEYGSGRDENFLGILNASGEGDARQFTFCISLNWDDAAVVALAPAHNVRATDQSYSGVRLGADDPDDLFDLIADMRARSRLEDWDCTVMGTQRPAGLPDPDAGKLPPK